MGAFRSTMLSLYALQALCLLATSLATNKEPDMGIHVENIGDQPFAVYYVGDMSKPHTLIKASDYLHEQLVKVVPVASGETANQAQVEKTKAGSKEPFLVTFINLSADPEGEVELKSLGYKSPTYTDPEVKQTELIYNKRETKHHTFYNHPFEISDGYPRSPVFRFTVSEHFMKLKPKGDK